MEKFLSDFFAANLGTGRVTSQDIKDCLEVGDGSLFGAIKFLFDYRNLTQDERFSLESAALSSLG